MYICQYFQNILVYICNIYKVAKSSISIIYFVCIISINYIFPIHNTSIDKYIFEYILFSSRLTVEENEILASLKIIYKKWGNIAEAKKSVKNKFEK